MPSVDNAPKHLRWLAIAIMVTSFFGFVDATYLSVTRFTQATVPCTLTHACEAVLHSDFSTIFGIPVVILGAIYYLTILLGAYFYLEYRSRTYFKITAIMTWGGLLFSMWLTYVQTFILKAFCQFCLLSALTSTLLFVLGLAVLFKISSPSRLPSGDAQE